jgi:Undecaprenyl-phosphate galactose phosphotransferase WbaP
MSQDKDASGPVAEDSHLPVFPPQETTGTPATDLIQPQAFRYLKRRVFNIFALGFADALALGIGLTAAGFIRSVLMPGGAMIPEWWWFLFLAWFVGAVALDLLPGWGQGAVEELRRATWLIVGVFGVVAIALFLGKSGTTISRMTLTTSLIISGPLVLLFRNICKGLLIRVGRWGLPTVVYGANETAQLAIRALEEDAGLGFVPVGVFADDVKPGSDSVVGVPVLGGLADSTHIAPAALLALPDASRHRTVELLEGPLSRYRRVVLIPDLLEAPSLCVQPRDVGGILGLEVSVNLIDPVARIAKRASELLLVIGTAPIWMSLSLCIALLIWLEDRKNPIFSQERQGKGNKRFYTHKFRTMVPGADAALKDALADDPSLQSEWENSFKLRNDPRITRVGRFLRKTSLDELPQLYNVLVGQMALVGPRPLPAYHLEELPDQIRRLRERVHPGVTGLWQVSGRSESGNEGMVRWDGYYVRNWSIWLDIVILVRTVRAVLRGRGAY